MREGGNKERRRKKERKKRREEEVGRRKKVSNEGRRLAKSQEQTFQENEIPLLCSKLGCSLMVVFHLSCRGSLSTLAQNNFEFV